ncbi:Uncaracterized surface protein containing fasciclin (FAS1) repeats [Flavobacterium fluvii]|uniref:Uncaracterized surface protein containing fasciclin (FAS1) repeats n=1 Tax=Flavobacterium fluvii TaxID=468056 RepID=A0A1M5K2M9_9FLAO|nr:fasciclin domain-containing protein [Flavobacterium fluvii]SHG46995.1 Uncaracterized surface protein containing fasciclin (FAS1) repeats [Flavobacterium fluvii]
MKKLLRLPSLLKLALVFLTALVFQNCTQVEIKQTTDETLNITEYLRANQDYSMFLEILDITNYASFMNTYGTYTMFLPTNEAVKQYLKDVGANSLKDVPLADLQNIAKLHILDARINTTLFTDGKIATPTMYGQYLITGAANINGVSSITINKTANIVASNLELGNGVVHVIDKVLRVADKTLAQTIEADVNLSLFTEVLKATGWYDKLNQPLTYDASKIGSHLTVLAQTNDVFTKAGFNSLADLKARYSKSTDPMNPADSLNLFVQYHVVPQLNYLADLATTPVFVTKAPLEVISSKLIKDVIYLNRDVFNGILEEGVPILRAPSDVTTSNGVLHYVDGHFTIKKRLPSPVYFDVCDQPEFAANVANYRKSTGASFGIPPGGFADITWTGSKTYTLDWNNYGGAVNGDLIRATRFRTGSGGLNDIEYKTPVIIKGRYKIWVSYRAHASGSSNTKVFFNGEQTSRILNMKEFPNDPSVVATGIVDRVYESQGYKRHIFPFVKGDAMVSRLVGIVEVTTTGRHLIKFNTDAGTSSGSADADRIDLIEFRPVDIDQIWPKFKKGIKTGIKDPNGDANGDGLIQREEATKGDNSNSGY